ncbi:hypothetical protein [Actinoallomurus sp. CA-150999]|uniref:hypothetical protein n=1 Tax=Actinoallomurus sp. CA-150999 TaxID=3239887 RepID=UPI003D933229
MPHRHGGDTAPAGARGIRIIAGAATRLVHGLRGLRAWVRAEPSGYAVPRRLELIEELPLLPSGEPDLERLHRKGSRLD